MRHKTELGGNRRLRLEPLEGRMLLSVAPTDVQVNLVRGNLIICGTRFDDQIEITAEDTDPTTEGYETIVIDTDLTDDTDTPITIAASAVTRCIKVCTDGGNDLVKVVDPDPTDDVVFTIPCLQIDTGKGDDQVAIGGVDVTGNATICTGKGNDVVAITATNVGGTLTVKTDGGSDIVALATVTAANATIDAGALDCNPDFVAVTDTVIDGSFCVKTGGGADTVLLTPDLDLIGTALIEFVDDNLAALPPDATLDDIVEALQLETLVENLDPFFDPTGAGLTADVVQIKTGTGNDEVVIEEADIDNLKVCLDGGDFDQLTVLASIIDGGLLDGGVGRNDTLTLDETTENLRYKRFEHVNTALNFI